VKNKILVNLFLEDGCKQDDSEVNISWKPINFEIHSRLFPEIIDTSIDGWLSDNELIHGFAYELIMTHIMESDGCGVVSAEYFEVTSVEKEVI
jgi:hypothetical protein